jgi:hypothetical protein
MTKSVSKFEFKEGSTHTCNSMPHWPVLLQAIADEPLSQSNLSMMYAPALASTYVDASADKQSVPAKAMATVVANTFASFFA